MQNGRLFKDQYYFEFFYMMNELPSAPVPIKYQITLPKINFKKVKTTSRTPQPQKLLQLSKQQYTEELAKLDQWANSLPTVRRKKNHISQSIMFLYKSNTKYSGHLNRFTSSKETLIASIGLYLSQLDTELGKIKKINYDAIYQNVEYCAGVYQIAFNQILKKLQSTKKMLEENLKEKLKNIEQFRQKKINQLRTKKQTITDKRSEYEKSYFSFQNSKKMQPQQQKDNDHLQGQESIPVNYKQYKRQQGQVSKRTERGQIMIEFKQAIEDRYKQLKPIKTMLQKLQQARVKVLYFSLSLGFDVRQQGLIWILKQINKEKPIEDEQNNKENISESNFPQTPITVRSRLKDKIQNIKQKQKQIPKLSEFPNFLTQQEINFIISKFKNNFKLKVIHTEQLSKEEQEKNILQNAFENVRRDRNRKLSMIKQKQLLQKLLNQRKCQVASGHKYITCETVRLMQNSQKIKYTKNQLVYKQTLRKLNKFCIQQIRNKKPKPQNNNLSTSKCSLNTSSNSSVMGNKNSKINENNEQVHKLMNEVKKMLSQANKLKDKQEKIKNEEQKQLSDILMKLRNERYEGRMCSQRRNPISVLACLVGWKKAKKIIQNQMNSSIFTSHQK